MISTYSDQQLVEECIKAGARGYVIKDIERFTLKESIRAFTLGAALSPPPSRPQFSTASGPQMKFPPNHHRSPE